MKALSTLKSALDQSSILGILALVSLLPVIFPHRALAAELQTSGQSAQVFEIKIADSKLISKTPIPNDNQNSLTIDTILQSDPLVAMLNAYLEDKDSPLAGYANQIVTHKHWQRALAISVVESNMCIHTPMVKTKQGWVQSYNCSGITGNKGYRIYADGYMGWFNDMDNLLDSDKYINRPIEKFIGFYVQPGSPSWLYGVRKTESELVALEKQADSQRHDVTALLTFSGPTN